MAKLYHLDMLEIYVQQKVLWAANRRVAILKSQSEGKCYQHLCRIEHLLNLPNIKVETIRGLIRKIRMIIHANS